MFERSSDSDTDSTVSIGEEADRHIEAPFAEYNGLLGRLVRLATTRTRIWAQLWGQGLRLRPHPSATWLDLVLDPGHAQRAKIS